MIIKNLTSEKLEISARDIFTRHEYTFYVDPEGHTVREGIVLLRKEELAGKIEVDGSSISPKKLPILQESIEEEETPEDSEEDGGEESPDDGKFICSECGAEFASARGLASHNNRVHSN